jgi:hypothetical protein
MKLQSTPGMVCRGIILLLLFLPAISCRKNSSLPPSPGNLPSIANKLDGMILTGSLLTESDGEGMALLCKNGKILISLEKIPFHDIANPGNIEHAEIMYSDFGVIIRDADTNQRWYYIQNDEKSQKRFEALPSASENHVNSGIAGTIKINLS